jgi:hypothetical protein
MTRSIPFYLAVGIITFVLANVAFWVLPTASPGFAKAILAGFCAAAAVGVAKRIAPLRG